MTTKLDGALKREITVADKPYTLTLTSDGLKLVSKGKRNGHELRWEALVSGDAALAVALNASLAPARKPVQKPAEAPKKGGRGKPA